MKIAVHIGSSRGERTPDSTASLGQKLAWMIFVQLDVTCETPYLK